jgi:hypothetical protein
MYQINIGLFLAKSSRFDGVSMIPKKIQYLLFQRTGPHIIMVATHQLQILSSLRAIVQSLGMVDINKGILFATHKKHRTLDLLNHVYGLQLPQIEISQLFLPKRALDVFLDRVDYALKQEGGQERQIVVA